MSGKRHGDEVKMLRRALIYLVFLLGAAALLVGPARGAAASGPATDGLRVGNHAAFVRVVVDFAGGSLTRNQVQATDPGPYDGSASVDVSGARIGRAAPQVISAFGVTVRLTSRPSGLHVAISARPGRLKYLSYAVFSGPRLAIDVWKTTPPTAATSGAGCVRFSSYSRSGGVVHASGSERGLFENQLRVVVRGSDGRVLAARAVTAQNGRWRASLRYHGVSDQIGTLEAVAASAKDGSLACLAQVRITLPAAG